MNETDTRKAILIDVTAQTVTEIEIGGLADMQKRVGGYIEAAYEWPNGDVLFVDEEGLLKNPERFFAIRVRPDQPLAGNGLLVGREVGDTGWTAPPTMTVDRLRPDIRFLGIADMRRGR